jgi:hypothetical protein
LTHGNTRGKPDSRVRVHTVYSCNRVTRPLPAHFSLPSSPTSLWVRLPDGSILLYSTDPPRLACQPSQPPKLNSNSAKFEFEFELTTSGQAQEVKDKFNFVSFKLKVEFNFEADQVQPCVQFRSSASASSSSSPVKCKVEFKLESSSRSS